MKSKFKIGQNVELTKEAVTQFRKTKVKMPCPSGKVREIYPTWFGNIITITNRKQKVMYNEKFLKLQVGWMKGFHIEKSKYDELDRSQFDSIRELRGKASQGKSTKRVMS